MTDEPKFRWIVMNLLGVGNVAAQTDANDHELSIYDQIDVRRVTTLTLIPTGPNTAQIQMNYWFPEKIGLVQPGISIERRAILWTAEPTERLIEDLDRFHSPIKTANQQEVNRIAAIGETAHGPNSKASH